MTLDTFIRTIKTAGEIPGSKKEIAVELYRCLEIRYSASSIEAALSKNEKKNRNPLPKGQNSINEWGFIRYFEKRTSITWPKMQAAFGELDEHGLIDRDTKDQNVFYESLLALFYRVLGLVPVSLLDILPQVPLVFGRETELRQLENIFETSNYAILTGIGGIGKSCVALAYAHTLKKTGNWTVQHIICEDDDTLQTAIIKLQFSELTDTPKAKENADKENLDRRIDTLKDRAKHTLIVLDNLNRPFTAEDYDTFNRLIGCGNHVHTLITSRNILINDKHCRVYLTPLADDTLMEFYAYHRFESADDHKNYIVQYRDILMKLFSIVEKHTLMIELLAKLPGRIFMDESEIYKRLSVGLRISSEGIDIKKDGEIIKTPYEGLVKMLFDSSNLTDGEKTVMRYMSIMPVNGIDVKLFEEMTRCSRREILSLKKSHWIMMDEEKLTIRLHPLICEAILSFDDTRPTEENCAELINRVEIKRDMSEEEIPTWHTLNKILGSFLLNVRLREMVSGESFNHVNDSLMEVLLGFREKMAEYISDDSATGTDLFDFM